MAGAAIGVEQAHFRTRCLDASGGQKPLRSLVVLTLSHTLVPSEYRVRAPEIAQVRIPGSSLASSCARRLSSLSPSNLALNGIIFTRRHMPSDVSPITGLWLVAIHTLNVG